MNPRLPLLSAAVLALAAFAWFQLTPSESQPGPAAEAPSPVVIPATAALPEPVAVPVEKAVVDWTALRLRLDELGDRMGTLAGRQEADRLFAHWMKTDATAALAWLEGHRGDVRFDRFVVNAAQSYLAAGEFAPAQKLAAQVVEASSRDWLHEEIWAVAYARRLVSAEELQKAGLSEQALNAIASGARR